MPQVTNLINKLVPKLEAKTLLDIGIGDGETIRTLLHHFGNPTVYGCDPVEIPKNWEPQGHWFSLTRYDNSPFYEETYDVITLLDSLPVYNKDVGERILDHVVEKSRRITIIWCPSGYYPYPPFNSCWHVEDFLKRGFCVYLAKNIHQGPPMVADGILAWKI